MRQRKGEQMGRRDKKRYRGRRDKQQYRGRKAKKDRGFFLLYFVTFLLSK